MIFKRTFTGICVSTLALAAFVAPTVAAEDIFAAVYSNTLVYTFADKTVSRVFAAKDGTWTATSTDPKYPTNSGKWANLNGWLCSTSAAMPKAKPWCRKAQAHKVGDSWTETQPDKSVAQITLVAGR